MGRKQTHFYILIIALVLGGFYISRVAKRDDAYKGELILEQFPAVLGEWRGEDELIGDNVLDILKADSVLFRNYVNDSQQKINFYASYHRSQKEGQLIHSPKHCYPGAGWEIEHSEVIKLTLKSGHELVVNKMLVSQNKYKELVLYWYQAQGRVTANEFAQRLDMIGGAIVYGRSDGSLIRVSTAVGEDAEQAMALEVEFLDLFYPKLMEYLPI